MEFTIEDLVWFEKYVNISNVHSQFISTCLNFNSGLGHCLENCKGASDPENQRNKGTKDCEQKTYGSDFESPTSLHDKNYQSLSSSVSTGIDLKSKLQSIHKPINVKSPSDKHPLQTLNDVNKCEEDLKILTDLETSH